MMDNRIKHLYCRAGFGLSPEEYRRLEGMAHRQALDELFSAAGRVDIIPSASYVADLDEQSFRQMDDQQKAELLREQRQFVLEENARWLNRMADPGQSALLEKMSLFWHGHFACDFKSGLFAVQYLNAIRRHALGNFRDLTLAMARDAGMIRYLNNQQNRKEQPNENFARELMELFTIGRGRYTETDVKEAARAFTGWSSNLRGEFVFRKIHHDEGTKTFMGRTGNFDGGDIIDMLLEKPETARFIARKAYRFFVNDQADEEKIEYLGNLFYESQYDIGRLMQGILDSDWFYAPENTGNRIKSPVELLAGLFRVLRARVQEPLALAGVQRALGQMLFHPPNVAGWPGGRSWIDNSTLQLRLNLGGLLFQAAEVDIRLREVAEANPDQRLRKLEATVDLKPVRQFAQGLSDADLLLRLQDLLLAPRVEADQDLLNRYTSLALGEDRLQAALLNILSLPEYQMC